MKINTNEYIPFKEAVKLSGRAESVFIYQLSVGNIQFIKPWNGYKLYKVTDVEKLQRESGA